MLLDFCLKNQQFFWSGDLQPVRAQDSSTVLDGRNKCQRYLALAWAVQLNENDALPGSEDERASLDQQTDGGPHQRRQDVVRYVLRIVRMAVVELRNHSLKCIQHIGIGAGIEVGGGQGRGGVEYDEMTDSGPNSMVFAQQSLNAVCDVQDFPLAMGLDREPVHRQ